MDAGKMNNAARILNLLDEKIDARVELTLYGRAALQLGFENPPEEYAFSKDVDAVFWEGQAEELLENTNFWDAVESVNQELSTQGLYISHFFSENQVILTPEWRDNRIPVKGSWHKLDIFRLGNIDLLLSKLMRDDPIDREDAFFVITRADIKKEHIVSALKRACIPDIPEIKEQLNSASEKVLQMMK